MNCKSECAVSGSPVTRQSIPAGLCVLLLISLAACGSSLKAGEPDSPTDGVAIWMFITDEDRSHALYILEPDGTLAFAGGFNALREEPTWHGRLTGEELDRLRDLLRDNHWLQRAPRPGRGDELTGADERMHTIRFASPRVSWTLEESLGGGEIAPVREYLSELTTTKRHRDVINQLPEAGPRRD